MVSDHYHHGDLRNALVDAGLALIREHGLGAFTLREVARRARVSHTAPYRHFRDKGALLAAIAAEGFLQLDRQMERAIAGKRSPTRRLEASGLAYVRFAMERPEHFRVMFSAPARAAGDDAAQAAGAKVFGRLVGLVVACQSSGAIRGGDSRTVARICWSQVHGIAQLAIDNQFAMKRTEILPFAGRAVTTLVDGLGALVTA